MKTAKPFRLGLLTRPYRWQRQNMLGVSVFGLITLGQEPRLMPEQELWQMVSDETDPGSVLDLGVPKAIPEMLASGYCYTHHQKEKTVCAAKIRVHDLAKSLTVFGDRYWLDGRATEPQPFEQMRVDWRHAYGGPGVPENPLGMGTIDEVVHGVRTRRMPHVEAPDARVSSRGASVTPAGFSALLPDWPQRMALVGNNFGRSWQENDYPGFADDMDWRFFNAAAPDQRWPDRQELPPGAAYEIWNMHPELPLMHGRLPDWRARCFTSVEKDGGNLRETPLRLTTVWFFPHRERAVLMWHGASPIAEDDAVDVKFIMPALELREQPRDLAHYQRVLNLRLNPETTAYALRDSDLVPKSVMGEWDALQSIDAMSRPMVRNLRAGQLRDYEARRTDLLARGLEPEKYLTPPAEFPKPQQLDDLPEYIERLSQEMTQKKNELQQTSQEMRAQAGIDAQAQSGAAPGTGVDRDRFDPDKLIHELERLEAFAQKGAADAGTASAFSGDAKEQVTARIRQSYLYAAHMSTPAPAMPSYRAEKIRRRLAQHDADKRNFAGMSLIGADLSGMDLRGADFTGATLEDANLSDAKLDDCNFTRAVLARAKLNRASLMRARLDGANLGGARCEHSVFSGASFREANCQKTHFASCNLAQAVFEQTNLQECTLSQCDLRQSDWRQVALMKIKLEDIAFDEATFERVIWIECALLGVSFAAAKFKQCGFFTSDCSRHVDFSGAVLTMCSFAHASLLAGAVFRDAALKHCGLRTIALTGADLSGAGLEGCDFSECDLRGANLDRVVAADSLFIRADFTGASLRGANLIDANLSKAVLVSADLRRANLFRADVSQTLIDASTRMEGAYTQHAQTWPARRTGSAS